MNRRSALEPARDCAPSRWWTPSSPFTPSPARYANMSFTIMSMAGRMNQTIPLKILGMKKEVGLGGAGGTR